LTLSLHNIDSDTGFLETIASISRADSFSRKLNTLEDQSTVGSIKNKLKEIWKFALTQNYSSPEAFSMSAKQLLVGMNAPDVTDSYDDIFPTDITEIDPALKANKCASLYLLDVRLHNRISIFPTSEGSMGFPMKLQVDTIGNSIGREGFFKWLGHEDEFSAHAVYYFFFNPDSSTTFSDFAVPEATLLFLPESSEGAYYQSLSADGLEPKINPEAAKRIRTIFTEIADRNIPRTTGARSCGEAKFQNAIKTRHISIQKQVPGCNFSDFLKAEYQNLDENAKKELFFQLGKIAFFDTVIGDPDRIIKIKILANGDNQYTLLTTPTELETYCLPSNTGNIIITKETKDRTTLFKISLIDNEIISTKTAEDKKDVETYNTFLEQIFSMENPEEPMAEHALKSLEKAAKVLLRKEPSNTSLLAFLENLGHNNLAKDSIILGMQKMKLDLHSDLIPKWNEYDEEECLKDTIVYDVESIVETRLNILKRHTDLMYKETA
jgi:hypothetical protein